MEMLGAETESHREAKLDYVLLCFKGESKVGSLDDFRFKIKLSPTEALSVLEQYQVNILTTKP